MCLCHCVMENQDQFVVISLLLIRYGAGTCFGTGEQETAVLYVGVSSYEHLTESWEILAGLVAWVELGNQA